MLRIGAHKVIAAVVAFLMPAEVVAQGASIAGTVKDSTGGILPGVTVEASSPVLIERARSAVTNDNGVYRIVELQPGTYTVTFTLPGFAIVRREGLDLPSNFTTCGHVAVLARRPGDAAYPEPVRNAVAEYDVLSGGTPAADRTQAQRVLSLLVGCSVERDDSEHSWHTNRRAAVHHSSGPRCEVRHADGVLIL